jgi:hypothetical protein
VHVGICGYPGSGKSTVFQALAPGARTGKGVTYGNVKVPDGRVDRLATIFKPKKTTFAEVTFLDFGGTAGNVKTGAFPPELVQNMRNADLLVHVVRVFANPMVMDDVSPSRDEGRFGEELLLIDLAVLERRATRQRKENKKGLEVEVNTMCVEHLEEGEPLRSLGLSDDQRKTLTGIQLLSSKPLITLYNFSEDNWEEADHAALRETTRPRTGELSMALCGEMELEIASLDDGDQGEFLEALGLSEPARDSFIKAAYGLLDYISFLTAGPDECRAWPLRRDTVARKAAGKIHSDIERGFIRARIYRLEDLESLGSEAAVKAAGKLRIEGKEYVMQDGDVVDYAFNV